MLRSENFFRTIGITTMLVVIAAFVCGFVFFAPAEAAGNPEKTISGGNLRSGGDALTRTFSANPASLGAIPDSDVTAPVCQNESTTHRDVTFNVSGLSDNVAAVSVSFNASHTYLQDLEVTLIAPNAANLLLFSATGTTSTTPNACGPNSNDLSSLNTYTFADWASANWWATAAAPTPNPVVPTSTNRTVVTGIGGVPSGVPATTSLNSAFFGVPPNGTWTLRFRDRGTNDTGTVAAANLTIVLQQHIVDFNGDGITDFSVARNTGGGASGQVTWFQGLNGAPVYTAQQWGIASDFFVPGDFDGDHKSDITVWRQGAQAYFYILQSSNNTVRAVPFGITGDDPTVIGDYTGDGVWDPAVYRDGATTGAQSFWYYLASSGPLAGQVVVTQWGQNSGGLNGDFPAPGDYNGDGKMDFCVQRGVNGSAVFYEHDGSGGPDVPVPTNVEFFGNATDLLVPGDYDGDGKTDIAVARGISGSLFWFYDPSSIAGLQVVSNQWGISTDLPVQGDYDGDGRTDLAIWRPSATPGQTSYYYFGSTVGVRAFQWGASGDYPVANYNQH
jgi:subtilisin-like proprotein convertase family protein